jgi:hypothetical protein
MAFHWLTVIYSWSLDTQWRVRYIPCKMQIHEGNRDSGLCFKDIDKSSYVR